MTRIPTSCAKLNRFTHNLQPCARTASSSLPSGKRRCALERAWTARARGFQQPRSPAPGAARDSSRAAPVERRSRPRHFNEVKTQRFRQPQAAPTSTPRQGSAFADAERNLFRQHSRSLAPVGQWAHELPCGFYRRFGIAKICARDKGMDRNACFEQRQVFQRQPAGHGRWPYRRAVLILVISAAHTPAACASRLR